MAVSITQKKPYKHGKLPSAKRIVETRFKEILAEKMSMHLPDIVDAQIGLAKGFTHTTVEKDGTIKTKTELPDVQAAKLLFEYTIQKPTQEIKHTGTIGIVALVAQLENDGDSEES